MKNFAQWLAKSLHASNPVARCNYDNDYYGDQLCNSELMTQGHTFSGWITPTPHPPSQHESHKAHETAS